MTLSSCGKDSDECFPYTQTATYLSQTGRYVRPDNVSNSRGLCPHEQFELLRLTLLVLDLGINLLLLSDQLIGILLGLAKYEAKGAATVDGID